MSEQHFKRWLRAELAAKYTELIRSAEDQLLGDLQSMEPAAIAAGAVATAAHRYGITELKPWTVRGGVWKRW